MSGVEALTYGTVTRIASRDHRNCDEKWVHTVLAM